MPGTVLWKGMWRGARESCPHGAEGLIGKKERFNKQLPRSMVLATRGSRGCPWSLWQEQEFRWAWGRGGQGLEREGKIPEIREVREEPELATDRRQKNIPAEETTQTSWRQEVAGGGLRVWAGGIARDTARPQAPRDQGCAVHSRRAAQCRAWHRASSSERCCMGKCRRVLCSVQCRE